MTNAPRRMGIKNLMPGLVERGKIKIGMKGEERPKNGGGTFQLPTKLDHFLITTLARGDANNFVKDEKIHGMLGDKPMSIPIRLLYDDIDLNFQTRYACYNGRQLWCSGDGETANRRKKGDADTIEVVQVDCTCERQEPTFTGKGKCKITGNLSVMIDGVESIGGVWKFRTTSYNSVVGILSSLSLIKRITGGPLAGVPLNMVLTPKSVTDPIQGSQQTIYVVSIEYAGTVDKLRATGHDQLLLQHQHNNRIDQIESEARSLMLDAPEMYAAPDSEEDDVAEFFPDEMLEETPQGSDSPVTIEADESDNESEVESLTTLVADPALEQKANEGAEKAQKQEAKKETTKAKASNSKSKKAATQTSDEKPAAPSDGSDSQSQSNDGPVDLF